MKKNNKKLRHQSGITLMELIISMTIGLILLMALASLMVTANRTANQRTVAEQADETARQVFSRLEHALLMANYVDPFEHSTDPSNDRVSAFLDAGSNSSLPNLYAKRTVLNPTPAGANPPGTTTPGTTPPTTPNTDIPPHYGAISRLTGAAIPGVLGCHDLMVDGRCPTDTEIKTKQTLMTTHEVTRFGSTAAYASLTNSSQEEGMETGALYACSGTDNTASIPAGHSLMSTVFTIKVNNDPNFGTNHNNLYCYGVRSRPNRQASSPADLDPIIGQDQPTVDGVEEMMFRYLVTEANTSTETEFSKAVGADTKAGRNVKAYLQPTQVHGNPLNPLGWDAVVAVEACIIVAVEANDQSRNAQIQNFQNKIPTCKRVGDGQSPWSAFEEADRPENDHRLYRRYTRIFQVPNNMNIPMVELRN